MAALGLGCCTWALVAAHGLSLVAVSRGHSSLRCVGFSLRWLLSLRRTGSRRVGFSSCGSRALERRLSSCGTRALLLCGMWDLPGPGIESVSPALAGGFLTTAPPGKSYFVSFFLPFAKIRLSLMKPPCFQNTSPLIAPQGYLRHPSQF